VRFRSRANARLGKRARAKCRVARLGLERAEGDGAESRVPDGGRVVESGM